MYGATKDDWDNFDIVLGLTSDLLPVVSNPNAVISERSLLKDIGKTPSLYNAAGRMVGIAKWSERKTVASDIARWSAVDDYGICVQTRRVRALDIDVDSKVNSSAIEKYIVDFLGFVPPKRSRSNSGKHLFCLIIEGEYTKRILPVEGGIIEFLANGQQFVAIGTHKSGVRYEWDGLDNIPTITAEKLNDLWSNLEMLFGVSSSQTSNPRKKGETVEAVDHIVDNLQVLGWGKDGQAFITCPFKSEHTSDSGITETAYFPAGTNGYEVGHFKCLHAHCAGRTDGDFIHALKIGENDFEVEVVKETRAPALIRDGKGAIEPVVHNIIVAMTSPNWTGFTFKFDTFRAEMLVDSKKGLFPVDDDTVTDTKLQLERLSFKPVGFELIAKSMSLVAKNNSFDSAIDWLKGVEWDGVKRVDKFVSKYFGAVDNEYTRSVSHYMWSALAGRVLTPGVKAQMVPNLQGAQGVYKSTSIAALSPFEDAFGELSFDENDDNLARKMRGLIVAEISELRGMHTKELESIKAFVTRTTDRWIPKFKEHTFKNPRRCIFFGTTNQKEFLADETGNRRFLPFEINKADLDAIERDRDLLWAEARGLYLSNGVMYRRAQDLASGQHDDFVLVDSWYETVRAWLHEKNIGEVAPADKPYITTDDVMRGALGIQVSHFRNSDAKRVHRVLRQLGYYQDSIASPYGQIKAWRRESTSCR